MKNDERLKTLWMVPYADMMSTLVILFLALFAYSYQRRSPEYEKAMTRLQTEVAEDPKSRLAKAKADEAEVAVKVQEVLNGLALEEFGLQVTSRYVHLVLPAPVLFAEGSSDLNPEAGRVLKPLARLFAGVENPLLVEGHTDDRPVVGGRIKTNWELSAARSFSVIEYFMRQGLPPGRFHARGYGEFRPVASNKTPEGRRLNRRIEISLIREIKPRERPG